MPPKKANGYKMPAPLPQGLIIQDISKAQWELGPSIGKGGFGEIYSARRPSSTSKNYPYVVKIEPHENGPLFVEMHFYTKNCKIADVEEYKQQHKCSQLGVPEFLGSGSHEHNGSKYRFIVMEKFGEELHKLFIANKKQLPVGTVYKIALQMIDVLQFIHRKGYVHADLKGANILFSIKNPNQAYLVDFGLTGKFSTEKTFKPDPKKMHNGTIEYTSRDAHNGVLTRRGDFEILGYNILHWLGGTLPWDSKLSDVKKVQILKEESMGNIPEFVKKCLKDDSLIKTPSEYLKYVNNLKFNEQPDYDYVKKIFKAALKAANCTEKSPLVFSSNKSTTKRKSEGATPKKTTKRPRKNGMAEEAKKEESTEKENQIKTPARRGRRVNTVTTLAPEPEPEPDADSENGPVLNKEMQRLMNRLQQRKDATKKKSKKLNRSLDDITETDTAPIRETRATRSRK